MISATPGHAETSDSADDDLHDALAEFGLRLLDGTPAGDEELYLWPCNTLAWGLFLRLQTQWRVGVSGATGLDYTAVRVVMDLAGVGKKRRQEVFAGICAMEGAVLEEWRKRQS